MPITYEELERQYNRAIRNLGLAKKELNETTDQKLFWQEIARTRLVKINELKNVISSG